MQIWVFSIPFRDVSGQLRTQFGNLIKLKGSKPTPLCLSIFCGLLGILEVVDRVLQVGAGVALINQIIQVMASDAIDAELDDQLLDFGLGFFVCFHSSRLQFFTR